MEWLGGVIKSFTSRYTIRKTEIYTATIEEARCKPDLGKLGNVLEAIPEENTETYEVGILSGYRSSCVSVKDCLCSVFQIHNETLNIWTNIIPAIYFFVQLLFSSEPFMILYLLTVFSVLVCSFCAHTFNCMSSSARHVCFFFDYSAITLYASGCAVGFYAFALPRDFHIMSVSLNLDLSSLFLAFSVILSVVSTYLSCCTRFWKPSFYMKFVRLLALSIVFIYLSAPITWRMMKCQQSLKDMHTGECASMHLWTLQSISAILAGIFYASHIPERFFPGRFDIFAHSHQIFHIFGAFAAFNQFRAFKADFASRVVDKYVSKYPPSISISLLCVFSVFAVNAIIFRSFVRKLPSFKTKCA